MDSKEYIALAELSQESFLNRRLYEWKVNFGLWSSIGLWTYFSLSNPTVLANLSVPFVGAAYLIIAIIYILFWQIPIRKGSEADKQWKHFYMHSAEGLNPERPTSKGYSIMKWNQSFYTFAQSGFTIALLFASFILLSFAQPGIATKHGSSYTITIPDSTYQVVITNHK